jgi:hypothetical protein
MCQFSWCGVVISNNLTILACGYKVFLLLLFLDDVLNILMIARLASMQCISPV